MTRTPEELDAMCRAVLPGGRQHGKTLATAKLVAALLKAGHTVSMARVGEDGRIVAENVVGVPGFDDGRQLKDDR